MSDWSSLTALGDSFTEGLDDQTAAGSFRGWADRVAEHLGAGRPNFRYANLAIRGRLLQSIVDEQVPAAVAAGAALVTIAGGGNDLLRPSSDPDGLASVFEAGVRRLRVAGSQVVLFTGFDTGTMPLLRMLRGKVATYNAHLRAIADQHGCLVVDLWSMRVLHHPAAWAPDRLHLSSEGHRRVALRVCEVLGAPPAADWRDPMPPLPSLDWVTMRRDDLRWAREHLAPWVARRLRRRSSGDGRTAKRPDLQPL